jgi:hypothetical protein
VELCLAGVVSFEIITSNPSSTGRQAKGKYSQRVVVEKISTHPENVDKANGLGRWWTDQGMSTIPLN